MTWRPNYRNADPSSAWFDKDHLERQQSAERDEADFRHMVERRQIFEAALARLDQPADADRQDLWRQADQETTR